MNKVIDIFGKEIEFECMGCDIANHKLIPPGGYVYEDEFINISADPEIPIKGFMVLGINKHIKSLNEMTSTERFNVVETLLKVVKENLSICLREPTNYEARGTMLWAASWALNSFCTSGFKTLPSNHAIEQFSAYYNLTHGLGLGIVMPKWMTYLLNKDETVVDAVFDLFKEQNADLFEFEEE